MTGVCFNAAVCHGRFVAPPSVVPAMRMGHWHAYEFGSLFILGASFNACGNVGVMLVFSQAAPLGSVLEAVASANVELETCDTLRLPRVHREGADMSVSSTLFSMTYDVKVFKSAGMSVLLMFIFFLCGRLQHTCGSCKRSTVWMCKAETWQHGR